MTSAAIDGATLCSDDDRRVLILDDDADFADALAETLLINDFVTRTANSADEAVSAMRDFMPALALIDIRLGQASGLEQIARLRAVDSALLCIMITAYADTQTAIDALRRGADDFVRKPLHTEDLLAVVSRCLTKRRLEREKAAMEIRLAHMQKAESIARLTGGIAHEFNNLLTVVLGNAHFLYDDLAEEESPQREKRTEWIEAIERSAVRGARLTHQLLAYAQKEPLQPRVVDLSQAIASLSELLDASLGDGIRVNVALPGELCPVEVDPHGLEQAMVNLGLNARDAMPAGGMINILVSNRHLPEPLAADGTLLAAGDYVAISVSDNGEGMTDSVRARAFDPFFTTRDIGHGAGLGLSMVHGFAIQSGGAAVIESRIGKGTRVTLYLPRAQAVLAGRRSGAPRVPPSPQAVGTILVVEDDADVRTLASLLLEEMGYRCIVAETGARALALLDQGEAADLLFTDVIMPGGISGYVLRDEARRRRPGLRAVFTSGHHENSFLGSDDDVAPFLLKPYDKESLARAIADALAAAS